MSSVPLLSTGAPADGSAVTAAEGQEQPSSLGGPGLLRSSWLGRAVDTEEAWAQLQFAAPMILTSMAYYGVPLVSVMFSGHLGDVHLAGATLGNSWATVTGYAFVTGLSGGLETLCGQAYGAGLYPMLGLYLQSSLILSAAASALVSALWWFTEPLLLCLRQDPEVSRAAAAFVRPQVPGLFAFAFLQCLLRYLQAQSAVAPLVVCSAAPFALHVALAHLLVNVLGMGLTGAAAAISATFWASCLMLLAYVMRSEVFGETWKGFSAEAFGYVVPTVKLAAPSAVMVCLEIWAFELLVLVAGLLPNSTVSTSLIALCSSTEAIAFMITYGFSAAVMCATHCPVSLTSTSFHVLLRCQLQFVTVALCLQRSRRAALLAPRSTRVSNEIGAGNVGRAKNAVSVTMKLSVLLAISFVLLLALGHDLWTSLFSGSARILSEFAGITPIMIISIVLDSAQGVLSGVSRGCGWQHLGAMTNLVAYYFVGLPLAILFAFKLKFYTKGLWSGLICGLTCQACSLLMITVRTKWSKIAEAVQEKVNYAA